MYMLFSLTFYPWDILSKERALSVAALKQPEFDLNQLRVMVKAES